MTSSPAVLQDLICQKSHGILYGHLRRAKLPGSRSPVAHIPPYHSPAPLIGLETSTKRPAKTWTQENNARSQQKTALAKSLCYQGSHCSFNHLTLVRNTHVETHDRRRKKQHHQTTNYREEALLLTTWSWLELN